MSQNGAALIPYEKGIMQLCFCEREDIFQNILAFVS